MVCLAITGAMSTIPLAATESLLVPKTTKFQSSFFSTRYHNFGFQEKPIQAKVLKSLVVVWCGRNLNESQGF
jgi:hypothetical protein